MAEEMDANNEDVFMSEMMDSNATNESSMPFSIESLLKEPLRLKTRLEFKDIQTPPLCSGTDRKRKNPTRRCLSTDLGNTSFTTPEHKLSPTFLQLRDSKLLNDNNFTPVLKFTKLTPFDKSFENNENESLMANKTSPKVSKTDLKECAPIPLFKVNSISKIRKSNSLVSSTTKKSPFIRCHSENEASIMRAVQLSCSDPSLIGDFSKSYALPLIHGKHQDLKSISVHVLAQVLRGKFDDLVESFTIVDCRYPYEYNGGHIKGAKNIYSQEGILNEFMKNKPNQPMDQSYNKRNILVFHCEFSSERGPTLSRFLRNNDRSTNKDFYPNLHHPEIYLLEGGYKAFFEKYRELCEPPEYLPMHTKEYEHELKHYRAIVKSLSTDGKNFGSYLKTGNKNH